MLTPQGQRVKTDARAALMIAQCLSYGGYNTVYIPTEEDDSVKEYLWMRDDHKTALKKIEQQINTLCLRHGHHYDGAKWTIKHVVWLRKRELSPLYRETLNEYMASYAAGDDAKSGDTQETGYQRETEPYLTNRMRKK